MAAQAKKNTKKKAVKKPSIKKVQNNNSRFGKKTIIAASLVFAVIGVAILVNSYAETPDDLNPSDITAAYYKLAPTTVVRDPATNKVTFSSVSQANVVLADGTIVCDNGNAEGTITTARISKGALKKVRNDLNSLAINNLPDTVQSANNETLVSDGEGFVLTGSDSVKAVSVRKNTTKPNKLLKMQQKLAKVCNENGGAQIKRANVRQFTVPNKRRSSASTDSVVNKTLSAVSPKASAAAAPGVVIEPRSDVTEDQAARTNFLRASRGQVQYKRMLCLDVVAAAQAQAMANAKAIYHNATLAQSIADSCQADGLRYYSADPQKQSTNNNWRMFAENVGTTSLNLGNPIGSSQALFNAYVASPGHFANLIHSNARCQGHGSYRNTTNGSVYHAMVLASWDGGNCRL